MGRNKKAGIEKRVSEPVYPSDILGDTDLMMCSNATFGVWMKCLLHIWRNDRPDVSGTYEQLARLWGCSVQDAGAAVDELKRQNVCDVTICNGIVTLCNRRKARAAKARRDGAERVAKYRARTRGNGNVTGEKALPSSSLSSSSSSSEDSDESSLPEPVGAGPGGERFFGQGFKILESCEALKDLDMDQYRAITERCMPFLSLKAAAAYTVQAAAVSGQIRAPGPFVARCFERFEKEHKEELAATQQQQKRYRILVRDLRDPDCSDGWKEGAIERARKQDGDEFAEAAIEDSGWVPERAGVGE